MNESAEGSGAWLDLAAADKEATWNRFEERFGFSPHMEEFPAIREPEDSITFDISGVYGDGQRYLELTLDLSRKLLAALRRCVPEGAVVHVLDWQHPCYRLDPHAPFPYRSEDDWPVPALPNGDYHIFLHPEVRFGVFGHPWEQTICVFGEELIEAFDADPPRLFSVVKRRGGKE